MTMKATAEAKPMRLRLNFFSILKSSFKSFFFVSIGPAGTVFFDGLIIANVKPSLYSKRMVFCYAKLTKKQCCGKPPY